VYSRFTNSLSAILTLLPAVLAPPAGIISPGAFASDSVPPAGEASIALVIDDLGNRYFEDSQAIALPGPVGCAFLPYAPFTRTLAAQAHADRKEVLIHLPMQALDQFPPEAGELTLDMTELEFQRTVRDDLAAVPHASGINNHRGSLLTRHPGHMAWLMQDLQRRGLFFVDSRTTAATVARRLAVEYHVPSTDRRVFLDNVRTAGAIRAQFRRLLEIALRKGTALGIGHPYPETLAVLRQELARLDENKVRLVSVSQLIALENRRVDPWQTSLFH
jgi:polysaccharide deacetylase 2 family uncharacterized protein YibQ